MNDSGIDLPRYLQLARLLSAKSNYKIQVGAVIVKHSKPVAVGWNTVMSHPRWVTEKCATRHAEIAAFVSTETSLKGATVYVYRAHRDGTPALARPCENCQAVLAHAGVRSMVYSIAEYPYFRKEFLDG